MNLSFNCFSTGKLSLVQLPEFFRFQMGHLGGRVGIATLVSSLWIPNINADDRFIWLLNLIYKDLGSNTKINLNWGCWDKKTSVNPHNSQTLSPNIAARI